MTLRYGFCIWHLIQGFLRYVFVNFLKIFCIYLKPRIWSVKGLQAVKVSKHGVVIKIRFQSPPLRKSLPAVRFRAAATREGFNSFSTYLLVEGPLLQPLPKSEKRRRGNRGSFKRLEDGSASHLSQAPQLCHQIEPAQDRKDSWYFDLISSLLHIRFPCILFCLYRG